MSTDTETDTATDSTIDIPPCCCQAAYANGFDAGWNGGKEFGLIKGAFEAGKLANDEDQADEDGALSESEFLARLS